MQKYKKILSITITFLIIIGVKSGLYFWREYKYKPLFEKYLSERYTDEMIVAKIYRGSKWGEYECYTYLKNNPKINFHTFFKKDKTTNEYVFSDNYFWILWEREVQSEVEEYIKNFYKNIHSVDFQIMGKPQYDTDSIQYILDFKGYIPRSKIPAYSEVKDKSQVKQYYKTLDVYIIGDVNSSNKEAEYEKIFKVIQFVKEKAYNLNCLEINYGQGTKSEESSTFTSVPRNMFIFDESELTMINSVNDLKNINNN